MEVGEEGMTTRDNCRRFLLVVPLVDERLREQVFISCYFGEKESLFKTRRGTIDNRARRISGHNLH